jgi:hypothetical protein
MDSPKASKLMKKMIMLSAMIIIVIGIIYYALTEQALAVIPFTLGVLITSGLNIFKVRMLENTVYKVVSMDDQEMGKNIVRFQYLIRYLLTGVVLVVVGFIHVYTSPPTISVIANNEATYIAVWATLFPNAPQSLLTAPFISLWGALFGIFTLQMSVIIVRSMKLEKDGTEFIEYVDDEDVEDIEENESNNSE